MSFRHFPAATAAVFWVGLVSSVANDKNPEGDFRNPKEGDTIAGKIEIEGRTRNLPDGYLPMLFLADGRNDDNEGNTGWPMPEHLIQPNRRFEAARNHEGDRGPRILRLYALPKEVYDDIKKWRANYEKIKNQTGERPRYTWKDSVLKKGIHLKSVPFTVVPGER